jgi:hypothetical protein
LRARLVPRAADDSRASGVWRARVISPDGSGILSIFDVNTFIKKNKAGFHVKIPWWGVRLTPFILWESENSFVGWLPGTRSEMRGEGDYVIIADVCASVSGYL